MKTCLIVTGGTMDLEFAGSFLEQYHYDTVVAVDGGLEHLKPLGLIPDAVVGDFDTVNQEVFLEYHKLEQVSWEVHRPEKDETDTELAIETAVHMGAEEITILGGTGGRIDHMLANIHLLACCLERGISAMIVDQQNRLYLIDRETHFTRQGQWGKYISFIPLTEQVSGITLTGFKYPLTKKHIAIGREAGLCVSNELAEEHGTITFDSGILICVESRDMDQAKTGMVQ